MELKAVNLTLKNRIAYILINREKALNALNADVMSDLDYLFNTQLPKEDLVGVIISGKGEKSFAAGADIKEFVGLDQAKGTSLSEKGHGIFKTIENFQIPVIAAVHGYALGAGCELAMSCHMIIAGEKAKFGQPEVNLGLLPGYAGTQRLPRLIGKAKAIELLLTGDVIGATEAVSLGLANHCVPYGEETSKAEEILDKISNKGPLAISKTLMAVNAYYDKNVDGAALEAELFGQAIGSDESTEGVAAFIEKRKANF